MGLLCESHLLSLLSCTGLGNRSEELDADSLGVAAEARVARQLSCSITLATSWEDVSDYDEFIETCSGKKENRQRCTSKVQRE